MALLLQKVLTFHYSTIVHVLVQSHFKLLFPGIDFNVTQTSLTFPTGAATGTEMCLNISIIDDDRVEYDETFSITLTVDNPLDTINGDSTAQANITVFDNDGQLLQQGDQ